MTPHVWLTLLTCAGELALAVMAAVSRRLGTLRVPLALLSLDLFLWNFASLAFVLTFEPKWRWMDLAVSPMTAPLLLHFVLAFVGRTGRLRRPLIACYVAYFAFSIFSGLGLFLPWARAFALSRSWSLVNATGLLPTLLFACVLLVQHMARRKGEEAMRTRVLLVALTVGVAVASTELWISVGFPVPPLGNFGTLIGNVLLFAIAARVPRLDWRMGSLGVAIASALLATFGVTAYLAIFRFFGSNTALRVLTTATVTFALIGATRVALARIAAERERLERLATVGRFSSQLAHDLKNPLAALKGAAQFLKEEHTQGRPLGAHARFLDLMVDQTDRLQRVVEHYQRLGRVEPIREAVNPNLVVKQVLSLQRFAAANVELETVLTDVPPCRLDPDLIANAVENLVRNATEAMPAGGTLTVSTGKEITAQGQALTIAVADTGQGMDGRTRERAFDDFFTTKAQGSGLGLAFVRRVAEAHGGRVSLTSKPGKGTLVRLHLPLE